MARRKAALTTSADISTGTSAKTILQLTAPGSVRVAVTRASISFRGNSPTADKILVQLVRSASGGTSTNRNPVKMDASDSGSVATTGKENFSVEPTGGSVVFEDVIHPQGSVHVTEEIVVKEGETLGWVTTAPAAVNCRARFALEE